MIAKGTPVKCTAHNGQHTGRVAASMIPGTISIAWDGYVPTATRGTPEWKAMRALAAAHDLTMVPVGDVEVQ